MEKKNKVERVYKINIEYINFISRVIKEKLLSRNKEDLKKEYENSLNLVSNNISRVYNRSLRKEVIVKVVELLKDRNMSLDKFKEVSSKLMEKIRDKKKSNYIVV